LLQLLLFINCPLLLQCICGWFNLSSCLSLLQFKHRKMLLLYLLLLQTCLMLLLLLLQRQTLESTAAAAAAFQKWPIVDAASFVARLAQVSMVLLILLQFRL